MNDAIFSMSGRLTRRDYALTIAALVGGASLFSFAAVSALLPLTYLLVALYFREMGITFWLLLIMGLLCILILIGIFLPLLAIPATVRRLHDIGRGGWLSFPLLLLPLIALGLPLFGILTLCALLESMGLPIPVPFDSIDELLLTLGGFAFFYALLCLFAGLLCAAFAAFVLLKKGSPAANAYGEVPVEEPIPSVRAVYFSADAAVDRYRFIFRALIAIAAANLLLPILGQSVLYPAALILVAHGLLPAGSDIFLLIIGSTIYPIAALPLVLSRLHTLGRSKVEALAVFAALLPNIFSTAAAAHFLSRIELLNDDTIDDALIRNFFTIGSATDDLFIVLRLLCVLLSLIGIVRLLKDDRIPS